MNSQFKSDLQDNEVHFWKNIHLCHFETSLKISFFWNAQKYHWMETLNHDSRRLSLPTTFSIWCTRLWEKEFQSQSYIFSIKWIKRIWVYFEIHIYFQWNNIHKTNQWLIGPLYLFPNPHIKLINIGPLIWILRSCLRLLLKGAGARGDARRRAQ